MIKVYKQEQLKEAFEEFSNSTGLSSEEKEYFYSEIYPSLLDWIENGEKLEDWGHYNVFDSSCGGNFTQSFNVKNKYVIKFTDQNNISFLRQKEEELFKVLNENFVLPIWGINLKTKKEYSKAFFEYAEQANSRSNNKKIAYNEKTLENKKRISFIGFQTYAFPILDMVKNMRKITDKAIFLDLANIHNMGIINQKIVYFDW